VRLAKGGASGLVASSVEQQGAAVSEIARTTQSAAAGTDSVSSGANELSKTAATTGGAASAALSTADAFATHCHKLGPTDRGLRRQPQSRLRTAPAAETPPKRARALRHGRQRDHEGGERVLVVGMPARQKPRILARAAYIFIDKQASWLDHELRFGEIDFAPSLFFDADDVWDTASKLQDEAASSGTGSTLYAEALGAVLSHELDRLNNGRAKIPTPSRGGLAAWQQKVIEQYIEEHLTEPISLAALAQLAPSAFFISAEPSSSLSVRRPTATTQCGALRSPRCCWRGRASQ
jgi:hypothetical protein